MTLGLAMAGQLLIVLGALGQLRPAVLIVLALLCLVLLALLTARRSRTSVEKSAWSAMGWQRMTIGLLIASPLVALALYPPVAFDETLYHLPFVRAMATSGAIRFLPDVRFPIFPQLHEALCLPLFMAGGDVATHFVALLEMGLLAALLYSWPESRHAGLLAAALFLGHPIVVQLGTVTYVDMALALFVTAGFLCLDRARPASAGLCFGTACSVKYLGGYFALAALVYLLLFHEERRRSLLRFTLTFAAALLPMYLLMVSQSGNPLFPYLSSVFGKTPWSYGIVDRAATFQPWRILWDATFGREHLNHQPPYSPLFALAVLITLGTAFRNRRAAFLAALCTLYLVIFPFLPQDSRYLLSLLPLVSVAAATVTSSWLAPRSHPRALAVGLSLLALAPGLAYAGFRLLRQGAPPLSAAQRQEYLERNIAEYRALEHRGAGRLYVCGAEQLKYFGGDDVAGDVMGPLANVTFFGDEPGAEVLQMRLAARGFRWLLVSRAHTPLAWQRLPSPPDFERVYADAGAVLWRLSLTSPEASR
jgi:hypothetical protein